MINIIPEHIEAFISKLEEVGANVKIGTDYAIVTKKDKYKPTKIKTAVYPGFPTDLQQPFTILLTQSTGTSRVTETIWENRFMHIPYLVDMGANIEVKSQTAIVIGPSKLVGKDIKATDLRAGAAMIAAGLMAEGTTTITVKAGMKRATFILTVYNGSLLGYIGTIEESGIYQTTKS